MCRFHAIVIRYLVLFALLASVVAGSKQVALAQGPPPTNTAFVLTTDFTTGSYSVINMAVPQTAFNDIGLAHSDALARYFSVTGIVYVVNRFGVDSIQIVNPMLGYTTPPGHELSVGNGSNPQDIAVVSPQKAYVSRQNSADLLIIDPTLLTPIGVVSLANLVKPGDTDGTPEPFRMLVYNGLVYVILQHLDQNNFFTPVAPGEIVVIDPSIDMVVSTIQLQQTNPFSDLKVRDDLIRNNIALGPRILVGSTASFAVGDGGIEAFDPVTGAVDVGFIVDEMTLGGNITHFEIVSPTKGYAVAGFFAEDGTFTNRLQIFDPNTGALLGTLAEPIQTTLNFAVNRNGELYLPENNQLIPNPGVRIFSTMLDMEITAAPISTGAVPPGWIVLIEPEEQPVP